MARYATIQRPGSSFTITRKTFDAVERIIADNKNSQLKAKEGMDLLVRLLILVTKAEAQKRSMGPVAPTRRSRPELANRIPVQQITGDYAGGWVIKRIRSGHWQLRNGSVEAYLIETGMWQRNRRPILKLSVIAMLRFMQSTRTADRFMSWVLAPRRNERGQFRSFNSRLASAESSILGHDRPHLAGPKGRLP